MRHVKIVVEQHEDGFTAYPLGLNGVVVGEGNSYEEAMSDVTSAIQFHVDTFGDEAWADAPIIDAFIAETELPV